MAAVLRNLFLDGLAVGIAQAIVIVGRIEPIVLGPDESAGLVFQIAAAGPAVEPEFLFIRHAVAIGVAIDIEIERIGLADDDPIVQGKDDSWEKHVIHENGVAIVGAVAVGVLVARYAAGRLEFASGVCVLHISAHFGYVHDAVAVEDRQRGLFDLRFG